MLIRSRFQEEVADCETIAFPQSPQVNLKCFRVDQGALFEWTGKEWKKIPVPVGKMWFNPHTKTMMIYRKTGWKPLTSLKKVSS